MELKSLFSGNKGIALATTVIIAVCLLFSYIYLQDGEDGITVREDVVIVCLLACAVDGKISFKEKQWIKRLID